MQRRIFAVGLLLLAALLSLGLLTGCDNLTTGTAEAKAHPPVDKPCASCHNFSHGIAYKGSCEGCHKTESWSKVTYKHKVAKTMDAGMHAVMGCSFCHQENAANPNPDCRTCHKAPASHATIAARASCSGCHTPIAFHTPVPTPKGHVSLKGGHAGIACLTCHTKMVGTKPYKCVDCHGVQHGGLTDCAKCHTVDAGFKKTTFKHDSVFKLLGVHADFDCAKCHPNREFAKVPGRECVDCHGARHGGLTQCDDCHTTTSFIPSTFNHSRVFRLTGRHLDLYEDGECEKCHPDNKFAIAPGTVCVDCHGEQHGGLTDCAACHTTSAFDPSTFSHDSVFPLVKVHSQIACSSCHPGGLFAQNISDGGTDCVDCHGPQHGGLTRCQDCHTPTKFKPSTFKHATKFRLVGTHAKLDCAKCHPSRKYAIVAGTHCVDCHGEKHGGQTRCERCHTPTSFSDVDLGAIASRHTSRFPLKGQHFSASCSGCHPGLVFSNRPSHDCVDCHGAHHGSSLTNCSNCHTPSGFKPANFDHSDYWVREGTHATLACNKCHKDWPNVDVAGTRCVDCHGEKHGGQTQCQNCHQPTSFDDLKWPVPHPDSFPLESFHAGTESNPGCTNCHPGNNFGGARTACVTCHSGTVNAAHVNPTDCQRCHSTAGWDTAPYFTHPALQQTPDHDTFPCASCHTTGHFASPAPTCTPCH